MARTTKIPRNKRLATLRSAAFPGPEAEAAFSLQERLDQSQWSPRADQERYQLVQLKNLVRFAAEHVEAYANLKAATVLKAASLAEALAAIPILPRDTLASAPLSFRPDVLPTGHRLAGTRRSSGTGGNMVSVDVTNVSYGWQCGLTFRSFLWSRVDFSKTIAGIRMDRAAPAPYPEGVVTAAWDAPAIFPFATGPAAHLGTTASIEQQWEWLSRVQPDYLMTYPSIIRALAAQAADTRRRPCALAGIRTVGETVDPDLRDAAREHLGADIHDVYSAEEVGLIACQCAKSRRYHAQEETVIVEILDDDRKPCAPGQLGRVVVTPLFNYASPLLRYELGDIAEAGAPCTCGRGLTTINRIVGRHRNIMKLRDGRSFWPSFGTKTFSSFLRVRQHQFRQMDYDRLDVVFATSDQVTPELEERVRQAIQKRLPAPMQISFAYVNEIPREPGGKYQEFVSLVP